MDPLWAELINSDWHDYLGKGEREDRIERDDWLEPFLRRCGWAGEKPPTGVGREQLRILRALLRRVVDRLVGGKPPESWDLITLETYLGKAWLVHHLEVAPEGYSLDLVPVSRDLAFAMGAIVTSFAKVLAEGEVGRIKLCGNPDCGWVMYDESRNRTRRWCETAECGNLMKVRRFRQRKKKYKD